MGAWLKAFGSLSGDVASTMSIRKCVFDIL
jgi:hypothetical protein